MYKISTLKKLDSKNPSAFRNFICELIDQGAYLLVDKKPTLKEEKQWLKDKIAAIRKGNELCLAVWDGGKLAAVADARRARFKESENVCIGIAILKPYRGKGLGEKLLRSIITLTKKKLKPKTIYLTVFEQNKVAQNLYTKVGFREFARFPKWIKHKGHYYDSVYMILKSSKNL